MVLVCVLPDGQICATSRARMDFLVKIAWVNAAVKMEPSVTGLMGAAAALQAGVDWCVIRRVRKGPLAQDVLKYAGAGTGQVVIQSTGLVSVETDGWVKFVTHLVLLEHSGRIVLRLAGAEMVDRAIALRGNVRALRAGRATNASCLVLLDYMAPTAVMSVCAEMMPSVPESMGSVLALRGGKEIFAIASVEKAHGVQGA